MITPMGFEHIICEVPSNGVLVTDLAGEIGLDEAAIQRLYDNGLRRVPVSSDEPLFALVRRAIQRLALVIPDLTERTCGILYCHSLPVFTPEGFPFLEECVANLHLQHVPRVAVGGQPCSIIHMGVQLASSWLLSNQEKKQGILLLGGDKAYATEERIFFGSAMGDAALAMFASAASPHNRVLASISQSEILAFQGEDSPPEMIARFRQENPYRIRQAINQCLSDAGIHLDELAYIIPHTPNQIIWDLLANLLRFPRERILTDYLSETGHLNSNDVFVHYNRAVQEGRIIPGQMALLISPGFGGTRGCTLLRY